MKQGEIGTQGYMYCRMYICIWTTSELLMFKVLLGSFCLKIICNPKTPGIDQNGLKFETQGYSGPYAPTMDLVMFKVISCISLKRPLTKNGCP